LRGPFQLVVTHPLVVDAALWSEVRDQIRPLFARIGAPVLPVVSELLIGGFARSPRGFTKRMDCAVVTLVLAGQLRARLWRAVWQRSPNEIRDFDAHRPAQTLTARAGDILYWPADRWHLDEALAPCLCLRLWIPTAGRRAVSAVAELAAELATARLGDDTEGLDPPASRRPDASDARAPARDLLDGRSELHRASRALRAIARGPALARELAIQWARRVSACGLEPVPAPRAIALSPTARIRRDPRTPIVRLRWRGESIWAANGHGFALRRGERALQRVIARLARSDAEVGALCRGDAGLTAALAALAEIGALTVTAPDPDPDAS
jgi:hypothetical protein